MWSERQRQKKKSKEKVKDQRKQSEERKVKAKEICLKPSGVLYSTAWGHISQHISVEQITDNVTSTYIY